MFKNELYYEISFIPKPYSLYHTICIIVFIMVFKLYLMKTVSFQKFFPLIFYSGSHQIQHSLEFVEMY